MSPTINYQSIDIFSFNHASDWPRFDASSTQMIWCCALLQHTVVLSFIIGPSCLINDNHKPDKGSGPGIHPIY